MDYVKDNPRILLGGAALLVTGFLMGRLSQQKASAIENDKKHVSEKEQKEEKEEKEEKQLAPSETTLTYWNGRGLCETVRLMLAATGEDYKEAVPGFPGETHLSSPSHMTHLRENGLLLMNQVPLLCIDGLRLVQSQAIVRYLARKHGLCGDGSAAQAVQVDMIAETVLDWRRAVGVAFEYSINAHEPNEEQKAMMATGNAKYLPLLERAIKNNGTGWFVGSQVSYCDILALEPLEQIKPYCDLAEYPLVRALHTRLLGQRRLSDWLDSDLRKNKTQEHVERYKNTVGYTLGRIKTPP